jgi:hypothetical protein
VIRGFQENLLSAASARRQLGRTKKVLKGERQNQEFPFWAEERSYFIIRSSLDAVKRFFIGNAPGGLPLHTGAAKY